MRLDALVRLVDSADFMSFREIALLCLKARGFKDAEMSDGWKDGGRDVRVFVSPPSPAPIAAQTTVERGWKPKLRRDALKAKETLGVTRLVFVTSHRIAEVEFADVAEEIWANHGVHVEKMDGPAIASIVVDRNLGMRILEILGINIEQKILTIEPRARLRQAIAYSFVFFGPDPRDFRRGIIEQAISSYLCLHPEESPRDSIEVAVVELLGFSANQGSLVKGAIDRMMQAGTIVSGERGLRLSEEETEKHLLVGQLRERDFLEFSGQIRNLLTGQIGHRSLSEDELLTVLDLLGALIAESGQHNRDEIERGPAAAPFGRQIRERLRLLHVALDTLGVSEGGARDGLLRDLTRLTSESSFGKHLLAGETFICLSSLSTPNVIAALGASESAAVVLDSSVAIPLLAGLLYRPSGRYPVAAVSAFEQIVAHQMRIVLPVQYLQEVASHLLGAYLNYRAIVGKVAELRASTNAFVAHFAALYPDEGERRLVKYLEGFGFNEGLANGDYYQARDAFMGHLRTLFAQHGIEIRPLLGGDAALRREADTAISVGLHELKISRPAILVQHDVDTVSFLMEKDSTIGEILILCTWDTLHRFVREYVSERSPRWMVLTPVGLSDLLSAASADERIASVSSPLFFAMSMSEEETRRGARVWDMIASIEKGGLYNAELLRIAREFKEDYLRSSSAESGKDPESRWLEWKQERESKDDRRSEQG